MNKLMIVVPAYNEAVKIGAVIESLKKEGFQNIIVVDDGSTDKTAETARSKGVVVLSHFVNCGYGAAITTGIKHAVVQGADAIATFDADGQHVSSDLHKLFEIVAKGEADIALGSRFLKQSKSNVPLLRKMALKAGRMIVWAFYGVKLSDAHSGLRAMSREAAEKIDVKSAHMDFSSEIVDQIKKQKLRWKELPVTVRYTQYSIKNSKQGPLPALKIFSQMIWRKLVR